VRFLHRPHIDEHRQFYVRLLGLALLVAYAVAFVVENDHSVSVHFVFATAHVSLIWVLLLALAVGLLGGMLLSQLERRRRRRSHQAPEPGNSV
jgi:uncharacterized integral membrane protein